MENTVKELHEEPVIGKEDDAPVLAATEEDIYEGFADQLIADGKIGEADLKRARRLVKQTDDEPLPQLLTKLGLASERDVADTLAKVTGLPVVDADDYPEDSPLYDTISTRFLKASRIVGIADEDNHLIVAVADPLDAFIVDSLNVACEKQVMLRVGLSSEIDNAIERQFGAGKSQMDQLVDNLDGNEDYYADDVEHLKDLASEAPIIRMVNLIIQRAVDARASDIHIEPFEDQLTVRYRVDGVLKDVESPPAQSTAAIISRIKIMAKLNIAERRLPQDGRIKMQVQGKELDLRVSTTPTMHGESVVTRLLDKDNVVLDFESLGFEGEVLQKFLTVLDMPHGILLITGPTGSGKTTNLYTALHKLNTPDRKIITVEDPVEYQLKGVNQIQTKSQIGLTFASALRSIVRQDPDVIMIGEMRDLETARIAVQSALTGHLVLSTLHTNDAAGSVTRLLDMGLEDYLLTSTVNGILAQRLVRRLCSLCSETYPVLPELVEELKLRRFVPKGEVILHKAVGCDECGGVGYKGRMAILEFLTMSDTLRSLVMNHAQAGEIHEKAVQEGMKTMYDDGLQKAVKGLTTLEEIMRVTTDS